MINIKHENFIKDFLFPYAVLLSDELLEIWKTFSSKPHPETIFNPPPHVHCLITVGLIQLLCAQLFCQWI